MTEKTPWADAPAAMISKVAERALLDAARRDEQRRIIRDALRQRVRTSTFRTADGYRLRRVPQGEGFVWTDGDMTFEDRQGSPVTTIREATGTLGEVTLAGDFLPDAAPADTGQDDAPGVAEMLHADEPEPDPELIWVAVYFVRQMYGGPEEGGWWYEAGTLVGSAVYRDLDVVPRAFLRWDDPDIAVTVTAMQDMLDADDRYNAGLPPLHSVNSKGRYIARIEEGPTLPLRFPDEVPTYE